MSTSFNNMQGNDSSFHQGGWPEDVKIYHRFHRTCFIRMVVLETTKLSMTFRTNFRICILLPANLSIKPKCTRYETSRCHPKSYSVVKLRLTCTAKTKVIWRHSSSNPWPPDALTPPLPGRGAEVNRAGTPGDSTQRASSKWLPICISLWLLNIDVHLSRPRL